MVKVVRFIAGALQSILRLWRLIVQYTGAVTFFIDEIEKFLSHPRTAPPFVPASCSHSWSSLIKGSMVSRTVFR